MLNFLLAILAGAALPVQTGVNSTLRSTVGNPLWATIISFGVGVLTVGALLLLMRVPAPLALPPLGWKWLGGALGVIYVLPFLNFGAATWFGFACRNCGRRTINRLAGSRSFRLARISATPHFVAARFGRGVAGPRRVADWAVLVAINHKLCRHCSVGFSSCEKFFSRAIGRFYFGRLAPVGERGSRANRAAASHAHDCDFANRAIGRNNFGSGEH